MRTKPEHLFFHLPKHTTPTKIKTKEEEVKKSRNGALTCCAISALSLYFEFSLFLSAIPIIVMLAFAACWRNETDRLNYLKTLPIRNTESDSDSSSRPQTPFTPVYANKIRRAASTPLPNP